MCVHARMYARAPAPVTVFSVCVCVCLYLCADKDSETGLSIPGSQSPSIITVNGLHMEPANSGYSNIPVYSNVRADYFS